jgi:histidinol-phosphate aminotransferase
MIRGVIRLISPYDVKFPSDIAKKYGFKESDVLQLGSNENPYPPSEEVRKEYERAIVRINRYPHPSYSDLKDSLAEYVGVDAEQIAVGSGASELLKNICDATLDAMDPVVIPVPSYTLYAIFAMLRDASISFIESPNYEIKADKLERAAKLTFLCSPNNPTGNAIPKNEIKKILKSEGLVVVDEAYVEFANSSVVKLVNEFENLVVVRSFSKFFGLAGLRIGYAIGSAEFVEAIEKIRLPFNVSNVAYHTAIAALRSIDYYKEIRNKIVQERERLAKRLKKFSFLDVYPSEANFVLVRIKDINVLEKLEKKGIVVRNVTGLMGLKGKHMRITVGTEEENDRLLKALEDG